MLFQEMSLLLHMPVLLFLDISGGELLVIMLVVFLVFGPEKMPDIARKAGQVMTKLRQASNDFAREIKKETSAIQQEVNPEGNGVLNDINEVKKEFNQVRSQIINDNFIDNPQNNPKPEAPGDQPKEHVSASGNTTTIENDSLLKG
jgi:sec-independent protein translocase protein TatA